MLKTAAISFTIIHIVMLVIFMKYKSDIFCKIKKLRSHFAKRAYTPLRPRVLHKVHGPQKPGSSDAQQHCPPAPFREDNRSADFCSCDVHGFSSDLRYRRQIIERSAGHCAYQYCCRPARSYPPHRQGTCRPLHDLLIYGICPGIGSVLSFVPLIGCTVLPAGNT
ncbi:MAG: hypothetical protein V8R14_05720 [Clostridia bacterium]